MSHFKYFSFKIANIIYYLYINITVNNEILSLHACS